MKKLEASVITLFGMIQGPLKLYMFILMTHLKNTQIKIETSVIGLHIFGVILTG